MSHWLSSSKVRLGLLVNGLYLLSLILPSHAQVGRRTYVHTYERQAERLRAKSPPDYAPLPSPGAPLKAGSHYWAESGQLDVYLTGELTLVRRRGHTLLLSPTFTMKVPGPGRPRSVLLYFTSFSHEQFYDRSSPFVIKADGAELWRHGRSGLGGAAHHSAVLDGDGQVAETLGHEIPFDIFVELIDARRVTIELGPDSVELTREQMAVLRDMYRPPPPPQTPPPGKLDAGDRPPNAPVTR